MGRRRRSQNRRQPQQGHPADSSSRGISRQHVIATALIGAAGLVVAAAVPAVIAATRPSDPQPPPTGLPSATVTPSAATPSAASPSAVTPSGVPLIQGDSTEYVKDVNYPDMSQVKVDSRFTKEWELKNTGSVPWVNRYIVPDGTSTGTCIYPSRVPVPTTEPGHSVVISVTVTAASKPQLCIATWKMVNAKEVLFFPGYAGFWFEVQVVNTLAGSKKTKI